MGFWLRSSPEFLDGGIVDDVAPLARGGGLRHLEGVAEVVDGLVLFERLAQAAGEGLLARPVFGVAKPMRHPLALVGDPRIGDEGLRAV